MVIGHIIGAGYATRALKKLGKAQHEQAEKISSSARRIKQDIHERREAKKLERFETKSFRDKTRAEEEAKYKEEYQIELARARARQKIEREERMREDIRERVRMGHAPAKEKAAFYLRGMQEKLQKTHGVMQRKVISAQQEMQQAQKDLGGKFGDINKRGDDLIGFKTIPNVKDNFGFKIPKKKKKRNDLKFTGLW